jgi:hypothetical protein
MITMATEVNMANNAEAHAAGKHPGYETTAWLALVQSIDILYQKRIKVIVNGGALNPAGLARKVNELVSHLPMTQGVGTQGCV